MTAGAPWSVKGINPKAREIAKDHARRSGMTLGEWLNRVILEDEAAAEAPPEPLRPRAEAPRPRLVPPPAAREAELARVAESLERLTERLEASETRTGLAVSGVEHAVRQALARIETAERESLATVARVEGSLSEIGGEQGRLAERLRRMEAEAAGPRSAEALRVIEQAVSRTAGQVYELEARLAASGAGAVDLDALAEAVLERAGRRLAQAEGRTSDALESLQTSLAMLDGRLGALEGDRGVSESRFEALARRLSEQVEAARIQFAERLKHTDGGRAEARFSDLAREMEAAERRSSQAIQEIGRQVLSIGGAVERRLQASEDRSAEAIAQMGGDMARVAEALEGRLGRAEAAQTEAMERLSGELGKISDRLSERLLVAERRAADAIEDVGVQVSRVTDRMAESQSRAAEDLAVTIRESESRTAQLLEETRSRLEQRLSETPSSTLPPPSAAAFGPELFSRAEDGEDEDDLDLLEISGPSAAPMRAYETAPEFAPIPEPEEDLFGLDQPDPPADAEVRPQLSTREVIEEARAAARAAAPAEAGRPAARSWSSGGFFGIRPRRGPSSTLQTAIMVAGGAAFLSVGAAGVVLMQRQPPHAPAGEVAQVFEEAPAARAAVALAPTSLSPEAGVAETPDAPAPDALAVAFGHASHGLETGQPGALAKLRAVADAGYAPAQFYLGKLYETGGRGVKANVAQARAWTQKAAEGGDPAAMHNLALFEFRGDGGAQDLAGALRWFRAAAEQGIVDSQYNLGLLYQSGAGAPHDPAQAYAWFSVAATGGDAQARAAAQKLKAQLSPTQLAQAQPTIDAYAGRRPPVAAPVPAMAAHSVGLAQALAARKPRVQAQ